MGGGTPLRPAARVLRANFCVQKLPDKKARAGFEPANDGFAKVDRQEMTVLYDTLQLGISTT